MHIPVKCVWSLVVLGKITVSALMYGGRNNQGCLKQKGELVDPLPLSPDGIVDPCLSSECLEVCGRLLPPVRGYYRVCKLILYWLYNLTNYIIINPLSLEKKMREKSMLTSASS